MHKFLKLIITLLVTIIVIFIITATILVLFVNPNQFKPYIIQKVKIHTGRDLILDGPLAWSFFPAIGLKTGHILLGNPKGFKTKNFAEIKHALISIKLLSLLKGEISSSRILLDGLDLNLIKNPDGQVNWQFNHGGNKANSDVSTISTTEKKQKSRSFSFVILNTDINNSQITYLDLQNKKNFQIKNLKVHIQNINTKRTFPISASFDLSNKKDLNAKVKFNTDSILDPAKQIYRFKKAFLNAKIKRGKLVFDAVLSGNILLDVNKQMLFAQKLQLKIANLTANGELKIASFNTNMPNINGWLQITPFDLKNLLTQIGTTAVILQQAEKVKGNIKISGTTKNVLLNGALSIDHIKASNLNIYKLIVPLHFENSILQLSNIQADLYHGKLLTDVKINLQNTPFQLALNAELKNIDAQPLFVDLTANKSQKLSLSGLANVTLNITTKGEDVTHVLQNLNGQGQFNFNNGTLTGMDINYQIDHIISLLQKKGNTTTDQGKTNFGNLTGTANIRNGIISNNNLLLTSNRFSANGQGNINLPANSIDYTLQIGLKNNTAHTDISSLYGIAIPISIRGNLSDPSISLDIAAIMQAIAKEQFKNAAGKFEKRIEKKLNIQLPDNASQILQNFLNH